MRRHLRALFCHCSPSASSPPLPPSPPLLSSLLPSHHRPVLFWWSLLSPFSPLLLPTSLSCFVSAVAPMMCAACFHRSMIAHCWLHLPLPFPLSYRLLLSAACYPQGGAGLFSLTAGASDDAAFDRRAPPRARLFVEAAAASSTAAPIPVTATAPPAPAVAPAAAAATPAPVSSSSAPPQADVVASTPSAADPGDHYAEPLAVVRLLRALADRFGKSHELMAAIVQVLVHVYRTHLGVGPSTHQRLPVARACYGERWNVPARDHFSGCAPAHITHEFALDTQAED